MKSKAKHNLLTGFFKETLFVQVALAVIFVAVLGFFNWSLNILNPSPEQQYASLVLTHEGETRKFEGEVVEGMTILDALNASTAAGNIELQYQLNADGSAKINQVNGYLSEDKKAYFYLNKSEIKPEEVGRVAIKGGDTVEVVFK